MDYCEKCMKPLDSGSVCASCGTLYDAPMHHLSPRTVLQGRYLVGRAFRETGRSISYMARDLTADTVVTVEEYFPAGRVERDNGVSNQIEGMQTEQKALSRFEEKAKILQSFAGQPGLVAIFDVFRSNSTVYVVQEKPAGVTLQTYLNKKGRLPAETLLEQMKPMLRTLQLIHERNLIHRRISPEAIRLYPDGSVKLVDFGAAGENMDKSWLKRGFAAPEQYALKSRSDPKSDIYSLCASIYTAITGCVLPSAAERELDDYIREPSSLGCVLTERQQSALMQGLEVRSERRLGSVRALMLAMDLMEVPPVEESVVEEEPAAEEQEQTLTEEVLEAEAPVEEVVAEEAPAEELAAEEVPAEEAVAEESSEEVPAAEAQEGMLTIEDVPGEMGQISWKELLDLTRVEEQEEDIWGEFIESTREQPADPVSRLGYAAPAVTVSAKEIEESAEEEISAEEDLPAQTEFAAEVAPVDVNFDAGTQRKRICITDKKLFARWIALGIMALVVIAGVICVFVMK